MILEEETYKKFGYYSGYLPTNSHKRIIVKCDDCGEIREISKRGYRCFCKSCSCRGKKNPFFGKHHTEAIKKKMSDVWDYDNHITEQLRKKRSINGKERKHTKETKEKLREMRKGEKNPMYGCRGEKSPAYGKKPSEGTRQKLREARRKQIFPTHHTKPELIFEGICERNNLDFHYVGDGQLWIGKKGKKQLNPDFIEANGKKICVEIMGAYWHSRLLNQNLREDALLPYREKHYRKYNWIPFFIWDTDLLRKDAEQFVLNALKDYEK